MDKKPFFLTCPKCCHDRFVFPIVKSYRCASCGSQVRVRSQGSYLIESIALTPASLLLYWAIAGLLQSQGLDRDASQGWGIFAAFLVTLPVYAALRPYVVALECAEPSEDETHGPKGDQDRVG